MDWDTLDKARRAYFEKARVAQAVFDVDSVKRALRRIVKPVKADDSSTVICPDNLQPVSYLLKRYDSVSK
jgi:hypothetical protein